MSAPLEYTDLSCQAFKRIKQLILNGKLAPGEKILQEKIAEEFGISRMPLHKAFQMLEDEMLVERIPRRGIYVKEVNIQDIIDAFECRGAIEALAVKRAVDNLTPSDFKALRNLFAPFASNLKKADMILYEEADHIFHNSILRKSGNLILMRMEMLGNIISRTYQRGLIRSPEETFYEHMEIIDALECKDAGKAEKLLKDHFQKSINRIQEFKIEETVKLK